MSLLTPLYVLGLLAVSAPLIFHLIRRSPKGEVRFSSLMFLSPSPPRLTRRSRLDNILLLILRVVALCLLAMAFARPFLRTAAAVDRESMAGRRIAVLVDTSASMRRSDLWERALRQVNAVIDSLRPEDELAVVAFDSSIRSVVSFEDLAKLPADQRPSAIRQRLGELGPTWGATNLGQALIDAVAVVNDAVDTSEETSHRVRRVVLVSDLQVGSRLDELGGFNWPRDVDLEIKTIASDAANAGLQRLQDPQEFSDVDATPEMRVRVSNDPETSNDRFLLRWVGEGIETTSTNSESVQADATDKSSTDSALHPVEVYVPPGESRVVRIPHAPANVHEPRLSLTGDQHEFDNTLYIAAKQIEEVSVLYVGPDSADDAAGLHYFLASAFSDTPRRTIRVDGKSPNDSLVWTSDESPQLVVVTSETTPANQAKLRQYVEAGGTVVFVITQPGESPTLASLAGVKEVETTTGAIRDYALMTDIVFDHSLFAALSSPQFNDFTKIHFWQYRELDPTHLIAEDSPTDSATTDHETNPVRVIASFDTGDAAIIEKKTGEGYLLVMTSGWHPADSQLARSTKFVPMTAAMLDRSKRQYIDTTTYIVSQRIPLPAGGDENKWSVQTPAGDELQISEGATHFAQADAPGIYKFRSTDDERTFAVNLDPRESKTATLPMENLEQLRLRIVDHDAAATDPERRRQMRDVELESQQKVWQWLILAAVFVLIAETWLAGRKDVTAESQSGDPGQ
ncbi:MAG: BatA domain-containing protein [Pirellulales bacterium]|nr:BatA domain-containing protein [Pirellulales bacterium]